MQLKGNHVAGDERILGSGEFVERVLRETEGNARLQFSGYERKRDTEKLIREYCKKEDINIKELQAGSRRQVIAGHRKKLIKILVEGNGESLAETARRLGVSTSAISKALSRG
ncbi:MAG: hypothetical protein P1P81_02345 [Desulfobulbales bacterium]|nr:hypothetical protein [Desulfobulbales bacterium]